MERTTEELDSGRSATERAGGEPVWGLVLAWCSDAPERLGEVALLGHLKGHWVFGRGNGAGSAPRVRRAAFVRQRPGGNDPGGPLTSPSLSREQLAIGVTRDGLTVQRIGRQSLAVDGVATDQAEVGPGAVLSVGSGYALLVERRPAVLPAPQSAPTTWFPFGAADGRGMIGESPTAWAFRDQLALVASLDAHTLVVGPSGAGKELAARAVHASGRRALGPFITRNASTLPSGLIDAELFGNAKNYPHHGLPGRPGLIGAAHRGVLYLDEIGELDLSAQAHLLRALDAGGEYNALGEACARRSDFRLVAATNRDPRDLRQDFFRRFKARLDVPDLSARRADVPILLRTLLERARTEFPAAERFFGPHPRVAPAFILDLLKRPLPGNFRDLEALVWRQILTSTGDTLGAGTDLCLPPSAPLPTPSAPSEAERIRAALAQTHGNLAEAARTLGLSSRFALYRRIRQLGLDVASLRQNDSSEG